MTTGGAAAELVGRTLDGRYRIETLLGRGGMGAVYRARHLMLDQIVAVKVLLPELTTDQDSARRFIREAKSTFRLDHAHCVRVSDFGATPDGILYLVMDYLDGRTVLQELNVDGPMRPDRVAHILAQTASALDHAHNLGLVHRDLKGENIMLIRRGGDPDFVKVLDFGLAKLWDEEGGGLSRIMSVAALTQKGLTFGTPHYMSPEQARGESLSPASDVYTLAVCGYEMLTGLLPFHDDNPVKLLTTIILEPVPPPSTRRPDVSIPPALEAFLMQCLVKDPTARPGPAQRVAAHFEALASELARAESVPPADLAASETMELPQTPAPAEAETRNLASPHKPVPSIAAANVEGPSATLDTRAVIAAGIKRSPLPWILLAVVGLVAVLLVARRGSAPADSAAKPVDDSARATAPGAVDAAPPPLDATQTAADAAPPPAQVDAGRTESGPPKVRDRGPTENQLKARSLVKEAKAAGSALGRLSKADAALRLDPRNTEARYLFGSALIESGQKAKGCRQLRRARRMRRARKAYKDAGCGSGGD